MLYLITGTNGAGKTLNTLKWVRERQLKENRPVAHNGRFDPIPGGELATWKKIDFQKWQDEPDGTIFLIDEAHNDLPKVAPSAKHPEYIRMLAEHRKRGFDFYLISQHPLNVDSFVRRLIGSPGWHRHLKRTFGGDLVSVLEWSAVNDKCEKDGSGKSGTVSMVPFPKEVFSWYNSASLHTGKKKIPKTVWALLIMLFLIPILLFGAYKSLQSNTTKHIAGSSKESADLVRSNQQQVQNVPSPGKSTEDYLAERTPRISSFPHTAPVYDDVLKPREAPYPAACIEMKKTCKCYTQQGTLLAVTAEVCTQIVAQGFFMDWHESSTKQREQQQTQLVQSSAARVVAVQNPQNTFLPEKLQPRQPTIFERNLAMRNLRVQSALNSDNK